MSNKTPLSKNFSRRSFLKIFAGFLAIFSFGGFGGLINSFNKPIEPQKTAQKEKGYGANTYGN